MPDTSDLEERWRSLLSPTVAAAHGASTLKRIVVGLARPEGYESLKKVEGLLRKLDDLKGAPDDLLQAARKAAAPTHEWLTKEWQQRAKGFIAGAVEYFADRAITLEIEGLTLLAAPVDLRVDPPRDRADLLYAGEVVKANLPLVADRLFREREAAIARLERASTPPDQLADQLLSAYDSLCRLRGQGPGVRLRLSDLQFQLFVDRQTLQARASLTLNKIKEYPRAQFSYDLSLLLAAPHFQRRGGRKMVLGEASPSASKSRTASVQVVSGDGTRSAWADLRVS